jgi:hypothetical protein
MRLKYPSYYILLLCLPYWGQAQPATSKSPYGTYYFDGDDVVFEFDLRSYAQAARSADSLTVDFIDLHIEEVAVSGSFNGWSAEGWKMQRVDDYRFRLRKNLADFNDAFDWQFRFLINGVHWVPYDTKMNKPGVLGRYNIPNPDAPTPPFGDTGNVVFRLEGFTDRRQVILAGTFNNWDEQTIRLQRKGNGWEIHLWLKPGIYEYKFIADGEWLHDPANPERRNNQYGTLNSVLRVTTGVRFQLEGFTDAREVRLAGSFTDWERQALPMRRTETGWAIELPLVAGKHHYKYIVDGNWMTDPGNLRIEHDLHGNVNSVLFVR